MESMFRCMKKPNENRMWCVGDLDINALNTLLKVCLNHRHTFCKLFRSTSQPVPYCLFGGCQSQLNVMLRVYAYKTYILMYVLIKSTSPKWWHKKWGDRENMNLFFSCRCEWLRNKQSVFRCWSFDMHRSLSRPIAISTFLSIFLFRCVVFLFREYQITREWNFMRNKRPDQR